MKEHWIIIPVYYTICSDCIQRVEGNSKEIEKSVKKFEKRC